MDKKNPQRRNAARYRVKDYNALTVTVQRVDASSVGIEVRLLDLSHAGAKMRISQRMSAKEVLAVRIEADAPQTCIEVAGEVCWVTPATGDDWTLGCSFKPAIPNDTLREFAEAGVIERREHRRESALLAATAMWELRPGTSPVEVTDISQGGFCLSSPVAATLGERTLLELETTEEGTARQITGRIKWQVESPVGHCIGCEFIEPQDHNVLRELVGEPLNVAAAHIPVRSTRLVACVCGLVAAAILTCLAFTPIGRKPGSTLSKQVDAVLRPVARHEETHAGLAQNQFSDRMNVVRPAIAVPEKRPATIEHVAEPGMSGAVVPPGVGDGSQGVTAPVDKMPTTPAFRTWTDSTGQYRVDALLVKVENEIATFKKENGRLAKVPLERLSDDDVSFIRRLQRQQQSNEPRDASDS